MTASRELFENQYYELCRRNPKLRDVISFEDLLTQDLEDVRERICKAADLDFGVLPELVKVILSEINEYGHALVLFSHGVAVGGRITDEDLAAVMNWHETVFVTTDKGLFVRMCAEPSEITFGNKVYVCKRITVFTGSSTTDVYLPIEDTRRVFVGGHSTGCQTCKNKTCLKAKNAGIAVFDCFSGETMHTPPKPYDIHNCDCQPSDLAFVAILWLARVLQEYFRKKSKKKEVGKRVASTVRGTHTESSGASEVFVSVSAGAGSRGGHHASPVAHSVRGYYRRRSKYDSTKIYVEPFARGGNKEEREKIVARAKQVVVKL